MLTAALPVSLSLGLAIDSSAAPFQISGYARHHPVVPNTAPGAPLPDTAYCPVLCLPCAPADFDIVMSPTSGSPKLKVGPAMRGVPPPVPPQAGGMYYNAHLHTLAVAAAAERADTRDVTPPSSMCATATAQHPLGMLCMSSCNSTNTPWTNLSCTLPLCTQGADAFGSAPHGRDQGVKW